MKKLLILTPTISSKEGRGRYAVDIISRLVKNFEITVFSSEESSLDEKSLLKQGVKVYNLPGKNKLSGLKLLFFIFKLREQIKKHDIIHAFEGYPQAIIAVLASIGLNKKIIISGIGTYSILPLDKPLKGILLRWAYRRAYRILCISNFTKNQILKRIKLNNLKVIKLGVDYNKFQQEITDNSFGKIILSVGALKSRKGYHVSIPAMAEIKKRYPDIKYYIVGGKPQKIYSDLVKKMDLEKNIEFLQGLSDEELINLYYKSDIFLLTPVTINDNDFEGFGLVYLEAGACGKPVVGTYDCGAEDAIINNETGFLVPQNDIEKTAEAVLKLLDNLELAKKMGESGKKFAQKMDWSNVIKEYIEIYESI